MDKSNASSVLKVSPLAGSLPYISFDPLIDMHNSVIFQTPHVQPKCLPFYRLSSLKSLASLAILLFFSIAAKSCTLWCLPTPTNISREGDLQDHEHHGISLHDCLVLSDRRVVVAVTLLTYSLIVNAILVMSVARHSYSVSCCANAFRDPYCSRHGSWESVDCLWSSRVLK